MKPGERLMQNAQETLSFGITSFMLIGVVLLPWVTLILSELLLIFYRRAVKRSMTGAPGRLGEAAHLPAAHLTARPVTLDIETDAKSGLHDTAPVGETFHAMFVRATRDTTWIYLVAGIVYAVVMALAIGIRFDSRSPLAILFLTIAFGWPVVLTTIIVAAPRRRWQALIVIGYWALFLTANAAPRPDGALLAIFMANAGATIVAVIVRARRIRAVAPLVGAFLSLLGVAFVVSLGIIAAIGRRADDSNRELTLIESIVLLAFVLAIPTVGPVAGWFALRGVGRWYAAKRTSDQGIAMAAVWLIFASVHSTTFAYDDLRWMIVGLIAFAAFVAVTMVGFRVRRRRVARAEAPRLLVLRVFALGPRTRRLFDSLTARWRHIGSVQLIAGADLASSTVEPHEFLGFVRRRLAGRFLDSPESIDAALAQLDTAPDYDGRFRTTDFFCRNSVWRLVFGRLAAKSDVVLMDLRGFSRASEGCTYELGTLLNLVPLERVIVVADEESERFLSQTLTEASARLTPESPNRHAPTLRVRVIRERHRWSLDTDRVFRMLCDAAATPRQIVAVQPS